MAAGDARDGTPGPAWLAAAVAAAVAVLPFLRPVLAGEAFYFRDLSRLLFPTRLLALHGVARGELDTWNPLLHEGSPSYLPPVSYPFELLALLRPDERGLTALLALHMALAAVAFFALGRGLGLAPRASAAAAVVYALGGFSVSMVNFYVYVGAVAWAPLVVLTFVRASSGGRRAVAVAALTLAIALSTCGAEVVLQTLVCAWVLAFAAPADLRRGAPPLAAATALALALASPTIACIRAMSEASERQSGFSTDVILAQSVHPLTLPQVVVAGWHGDIARLADRWWGSNFFPSGFPYVLSLYVGATAVSLALLGAASPGPFRRRLTVLLALALWIAVGRFAGWEPVVDVLPVRTFRFPVKAFFTVHLVGCILVGFGLQALADGRADAWRRYARTAAAWGLALTGLLALPVLAPAATDWFLRGFLPPGTAAPDRLSIAHAITSDAAKGGAIALASAVLGLLVLRLRIGPAAASLGVGALLAADVLRAAAGLNPSVTPSFYQPSAETRALVPALRAEARVFSCDPQSSPAYWKARARRASHETWTFAVLMEAMVPDFNLAHGVPTARSENLTSFVPRGAEPDTISCRDMNALVPSLQRAGVTRVISLDPLDHPALGPPVRIAPARVAPLEILHYPLSGSRPLRFVADTLGHPLPSARASEAAAAPGRHEVEVESDRAADLVVLENAVAGWQATIDGRPAVVGRTADGHLAVAVPAGRHHVRLRYAVPHLRAAVALMAASLVAVAVMLRARPRAGT